MSLWFWKKKEPNLLKKWSIPVTFVLVDDSIIEGTWTLKEARFMHDTLWSTEYEAMNLFQSKAETVVTKGIFNEREDVFYAPHMIKMVQFGELTYTLEKDDGL